MFWRGQAPSLRDQPAKGRRGEQCSPGELGVYARLHGASRTPPLRVTQKFESARGGPMTSIGPYRVRVEGFWPRRGQTVGRRKSVKKNAALLHFLAFSSNDHLFGVLRGEQPLSRGSLPRNSETFFASFFCHKKGRTPGRSPLKKALPQGRQGRQAPPQKTIHIDNFGLL